MLAILRALVMEKRGRQARVAEATGISQGQLSKYLSGQKSMTMGEFMAVCSALGLTASDVLSMAERSATTRAAEEPRA